MNRKAYAVVDKYGNGYTKRHGPKDIPSVYDHERNANAFIKNNPKKGLRVVECVITYTV